MRTLQYVGVCALLTVTAVYAQAPPGMQALQGRWTVTSGEHEGRPLDVVKGGVMTVTGDAFEIRTAGGKDVRPDAFVTSDKTEASIVTMRRESR